MTTDAMINMASRTDSIAIWPSSIKFSVSFPAPKGASCSTLGCVCFHALFLTLVKIVKKNPFFLTMIS
jgi:hypothetical protein